MGVWTHFVINCDLVSGLDDGVIPMLRHMVDGCGDNVAKPNHKFFVDSDVYKSMLRSGTNYISPHTEDGHENVIWSLYAKGCVRNDGDYLGKFMDWISPWVVDSWSPICIAVTDYDEGRPVMFYSDKDRLFRDEHCSISPVITFI